MAEMSVFLYVLRYLFVFLSGGALYGVVEVLFRGYTHWTMLISGGICFTLLYLISGNSREPKWKKWIMSGAVITAVEFIVGGIVNIILGWNVWDYSDRFGNLMGQICLAFTAMWVLLSIPAIELCAVISKYVFRENRENK